MRCITIFIIFIYTFYTFRYFIIFIFDENNIWYMIYPNTCIANSDKF